MASATQRKSTPELITTSLRVEREKLDRFRLTAEANRRTVSQELRWLMDKAIEQHEQEDAA